MNKIVNLCLVGRPNAGKSTLMNYLLGRKLGIVSPKANTTRFPVSGSYLYDEVQVQLTDTPGWESAPRGKLGRLLISMARSEFMSASVVGLVIDGKGRILEKDYEMYQHAVELGKEVEVILSKVDLVHPKTLLLPKIEQIQQWGYKGVVWVVSARSGRGTDQLRDRLMSFAKEGVDTKPTISREKFAEECTREHAFKLLNQEVPYGLWVETKWFREEAGVYEIEQNIRVLEDRHKGIVLGAGGQMIKRIGSRARVELMKVWGRPVRLFITVKVGTEDQLLGSCRPS